MSWQKNLENAFVKKRNPILCVFRTDICINDFLKKQKADKDASLQALINAQKTEIETEQGKKILNNFVDNNNSSKPTTKEPNHPMLIPIIVLVIISLLIMFVWTF